MRLIFNVFYLLKWTNIATMRSIEVLFDNFQDVGASSSVNYETWECRLYRNRSLSFVIINLLIQLGVA
jgi:hypothetical protein